jgi:type I restriction enzyme S subunit
MIFYKETAFKDTEIGRIPKDWEVVKLGNVVEIEDKYRIPVKEQDRQPGPFPYCGANGIIDYVAGYTHDGKFVLLAEDGGFFGPFENSAYIMRGKFWANNHVHILKAIEGVLISEFLVFYLNFINLVPFLTGSTRPKLTQEDMRMIPLPLPSLLEQQKIAEILSTVDDAIQKTNEIIAKTERLKKGLMHELLTKGIGHKEFKDTEIGRIPKDWEVVKLGEITTKIKDIDHKMPRKQKTGIPFISIKCMLKYPDLNFYLDPNDPDLEFISKKDYEYHVQRFNVEMNDIIYSRFGSIGNAKLVTTEQHFIASYSIVLIKPNIHKVNPTFLTCVLNSEIVKKQAKIATKGATNRNLHLEDIQNLRLPLPKPFEQQKIAEILSTVDKKLEAERNEKARLERIKQGLMDLLLTGKVRVRL